MKIIILLIFAGILTSLASSLFYLLRDDGDSRRTVRALTVRVALSVALFVLLMVAGAAGLIEPTGLPR
ncbi:MAG: twin transmembrane helix small protein [Chromatiales bacterium]|nr:twin transmembrane helix small protein [Chromatiales bacterium]